MRSNLKQHKFEHVVYWANTNRSPEYWYCHTLACLTNLPMPPGMIKTNLQAFVLLYVFADEYRDTINIFVFEFVCRQGDSNEKASLFTGEEELFAFERAVSRISDMRSALYWNQSVEHRKQQQPT